MKQEIKWIEHDPKTVIPEIRISYHPKIKSSERPLIGRSCDAYRLILDTWNMDTIQLIETVKIVLLNAGNKVLGIMTASSGGMNIAVCDPRIVFMTALKAGASAIIITHNHPSGNLQPSKMDIELTKKLKAAGRLLDINVLDHLIISTENYYSFGDEGLM